MKILHCCLAAFYIDNYGYQENILPKIHKLQGHDVAIVASRESYVENTTLGYVEARSYSNEHDIPVTRLPYAGWLPFKLMRKIRAYSGLRKVISNFKPDIIFLHDVQFFDVHIIVKYKNENPQVKIYADGHTDYINSARNWLSKNILHKVIYKHFVKKLEPCVEKFFGVTPLRVEFFHEVYGVDQRKLDLLVLGLDDSVIDLSEKKDIREEVRRELGICESDFVIVSGGKIDKRKNIHLLVDAFIKLNAALESVSFKLILFGVPTDEMKYLLDRVSKEKDILYMGWLNQDDISRHLIASDLACFPGTHSVLWEQTIGLGIPSVLKRWYGMEHVDVGGNCILIEEGELINTLQEVATNKKLYREMLTIAEDRGVHEFSYFKIAQKAIGLN